MTSPHHAFADAEAVAGVIIRAAGTTATGVYSSIPKNPSYPLVVVRRVGGLPVHRSRWDGAEIQLDVWAESKSDARTLADAARRALLDAEATTVTYGSSSAWVSSVEDTLALTWLPDPGNSTKDHYVLGVRIVLRDAA